METVVVGGLEACVVWPQDDSRSKQAADDETEIGAPDSKVVSRAREHGVEVVFLIHGRLGKRKHVQRHALRFAKNGYMAIFWDNPNHGDRLLDVKRNHAWDKENTQHATDMYAQMLGAHRDVQMMLDILPSILQVNFLRTGIFGISQGGHTALLIMANEPRMDVCVSLISSGDYLLNMQKRYAMLKEKAKESGAVVPSFESLVPPALLRTIEHYDPIHNVENVAAGARPILMVNGGADVLVPVECNVKLNAALKPLYESAQKPSHLQHTILPGVEHATPEPMIQAAEDWFNTHLRTSKPSSL
mmetsp:Transcript_21644/g.42508  ORF Transcript_21644/g.42508 Transcript_21644/m.42508 type:complete len:302 (+) Transcript_21644:84-989(+)